MKKITYIFCVASIIFSNVFCASVANARSNQNLFSQRSLADTSQNQPYYLSCIAGNEDMISPYASACAIGLSSQDAVNNARVSCNCSNGYPCEHYNEPVTIPFVPNGSSQPRCVGVGVNNSEDASFYAGSAVGTTMTQVKGVLYQKEANLIRIACFQPLNLSVKATGLGKDATITTSIKSDNYDNYDFYTLPPQGNPVLKTNNHSFTYPMMMATVYTNSNNLYGETILFKDTTTNTPLCQLSIKYPGTLDSTTPSIEVNSAYANTCTAHWNGDTNNVQISFSEPSCATALYIGYNDLLGSCVNLKTNNNKLSALCEGGKYGNNDASVSCALVTKKGVVNNCNGHLIATHTCGVRKTEALLGILWWLNHHHGESK